MPLILQGRLKITMIRSSKDTRVRYSPTTKEIKSLIQAAEKHPLGINYLKSGAPDSVASTFQVHAFVVDSAREKLGRSGNGSK